MTRDDRSYGSSAQAGIHADRTPENRMRAILDGEGYVRALVLDGSGDPEAFVRFMSKSPRPPMIDVEMDGWPVDEHGRGLTVLEVTQQLAATPPNERSEAA